MESKMRHKAQRQLLALAAFSAGVLGSLLCVSTMLAGGKTLPAWLEKTYMATGNILALGCLTVYFCLRNPEGQGGFEKIRRNWLAVLKEELWILVIFYLWMALDEARELTGRLFSLDSGLWDIAAPLALSCAALFMVSVFLDRLMQKCVLVRTEKRARRLLKDFGVLAATLAVWIGIFTLKDAVLKIPIRSVTGMLALRVFDACCGYGILAAVLHRIGPDGRAEGMEEARTDVSGNTIKNKLEIVIPFAAALLLAFLMGSRGSLSVEEQMRAAIEGSLEDGYEALREGDMEQAAAAFGLSQARAHAFESIVREESGYSLENIYRQYQDDVVIGALYLSERGSMQQLESRIRNRALGAEWYPALLRYFGSLEELSQAQELLRDEILLRLAAAERYTEEDVLFAGDLEEGKMAAVSLLNGYQEELAACGMFRLLSEYGTQGGYTAELTEAALALAEANEDILLLQHVAYQVGSSYKVDEAGHYGRTLEAIRRFDRLFDDGTRTEEQLALEKYDLGEAAANCYAYEAALEYYEASYELSGESGTALRCADIQEKLGNYQACAEMAGKCLQQNPDSVQALYLAALSALKIQDTETALEMAGRLGDLTAGPEGNPETEGCLYACVQYLAMDDSAAWTDFQYRIYEKLSEEQIAEIKSHALLWDYMTAIYQCFTSRDYVEAAASAERILSVRDDLPMGWYLKGTIAFGAKDFGTALEAFHKAEECGGTMSALYFSIANTYEAMGDYDNAIIYSRKVEKSLPYQDHGNDVYGISYHNKNLLKALEDRKGE